jgi:hypothetical protein
MFTLCRGLNFYYYTSPTISSQCGHVETWCGGIVPQFKRESNTRVQIATTIENARNVVRAATG